MTYLSAHIAINFSGASSEQLLVSHRTQNASFVTRCDETGTTGEDRASQSQPGYTDATHLVIRKRSSVSSAATASSEELSSPDRLQQLLWRHRPPSDREQNDGHQPAHPGRRAQANALSHQSPRLSKTPSGIHFGYPFSAFGYPFLAFGYPFLVLDIRSVINNNRPLAILTFAAEGETEAL